MQQDISQDISQDNLRNVRLIPQNLGITRSVRLGIKDSETDFGHLAGATLGTLGDSRSANFWSRTFLDALWPLSLDSED